jgi:hypothetical protein
LEFLETAFYQQGFALFQDSDFLALGLTATDLTNLKSIGQTEQTHVDTLLTAIAASGTQPVAPCVYNFGFKTASDMVATAAILENVGVSAYVLFHPSLDKGSNAVQISRRSTPCLKSSRLDSSS